MLTANAVANGERVKFRLWFGKLEMVSGVVVSSKPDADKKKPFKYTIQPDKPIDGYAGTVCRYHPRIDANGKPNYLKMDEIEDVYAD